MQNPPKGAIPRTGEFFLLGSSSPLFPPPPSKPFPLKLHFDALLLTACLRDALLQQRGTAFGGAELRWRCFSHGKSSGSLPKLRFPIPNLLSRLLHPVSAQRPSSLGKGDGGTGQGHQGGSSCFVCSPRCFLWGSGEVGCSTAGAVNCWPSFPQRVPQVHGGFPR